MLAQNPGIISFNWKRRNTAITPTRITSSFTSLSMRCSSFSSSVSPRPLRCSFSLSTYIYGDYLIGPLFVHYVVRLLSGFCFSVLLLFLVNLQIRSSWRWLCWLIRGLEFASGTISLLGINYILYLVVLIPLTTFLFK